MMMDLFSHRVIGWSFSSQASSDAVMNPFLKVIWRRQPKIFVLVHSDQGGQATSRDWLDFLKEQRLEVSMSGRGNCHDNAGAEPLFLSIEPQRIEKKIYVSRDEARVDLVKYIADYYYYQCRNSNNDGLPP